MADNAYLEAQHEGKSPELCEQNSPFVLLYDRCIGCIASNSAEPDWIERVYVGPKFYEILEYCNILQASSSGSLPITTVSNYIPISEALSVASRRAQPPRIRALPSA